MQIRYLIVLNKTANGNKVSNQWPKIKSILDHRKINYKVMITKYSHHAKLITKLYLKQINFTQHHFKNILFAIGGDGTIHDILDEIRNWKLKYPNSHKPPIAFLPLGSDNNFAKSNHFPLKINRALNQILNCQKSRYINIGTYYEDIKNDNGIFTNNLGIGFDAEIVNRENQFHQKSKIKFKRIHLLSSLFSILYSSKSFPITVNMNNNYYSYHNALMVNISNNAYFNGYNLIKHADINDSKSSLVIVEKKNAFSFILSLFMIITGHYKSKSIHHFKSKKLQIKIPSLEYGQTDGEEIGSRFFDIKFDVTKYPFWF